MTRRPDPLETPSASDQDEEEGTSVRLARLPEEERFKMMGKIFALTAWPWPSPSWWIAQRNQPQVGRDTDPDAKERDKFIAFLGIEMGMSAAEWMRPVFRQEVFVFHTLAQRH